MYQEVSNAQEFIAAAFLACIVAIFGYGLWQFKLRSKLNRQLEVLKREQA